MQAIPFHSSIRIKLTGGAKIEDPKTKEIIGIEVNAKTIKNKISAPFRTASFQIHFGVGIKEHEELFDVLRKNGPEQFGDKVYLVGGEQAWKYLQVFDPSLPENAKWDSPKILELDKKFYKAEFDKIMADPHYSEYIHALLERAMVRKLAGPAEIDLNCLDEAEALKDQVEELIGDISPEE